MVKGQPYVKQVEVPEGLTFKFINCVDNKDHLYYAYLFGEDNGLYILTQDDYKLIRWPVGELNIDEQSVRISSDYFNYNISIRSNDKLECYALDKAYNLVDTYKYTWTPNSEKVSGKVASAVFPFSLSLKNTNSRFINLYPTLPKGYIWIILNIVLVAIQITIIKKRDVNFKNNLLDLVLILVSGIFGFIAINIFPNKLD